MRWLRESSLLKSCTGALKGTSAVLLRVTNNSTFAGGFYLGNDDFRLLADAIAVAPDNFINDVMSAQSVKEYEVIFMLPAGTAQADLQVGSVKGPNARIALSLR